MTHESSRIKRVRVRRFANLPIEPPPMRPELNRESGMILEIETEGGLVGHGPMVTYDAPPDMLSSFVNGALSDSLVGEDPSKVEAIWHRLTDEFVGRAASLLPALGAVDTALWDIRGKAMNEPVWKLLGGANPTVKTYVTFGATGPFTGTPRHVPAYSTQELMEEAKYLTSLGHNRLKIVVGRLDEPDPSHDYARVAAVRSAVGDDAWLMMDGRRRMLVDDADRLASMCRELDVRFFEEPVRGNDPELLRELRRRTHVPLAANPVGLRDRYYALLARDAIDYLQPNVASIGVTESRAVADLAAAASKRIASGNGFGPHNAHVHAGMKAGWLVEYHYAHWMAYRELYEGLPEPNDGAVSLGQAPGFGLRLREDVMEEYGS